jgi:hypothetical protein
MTGQAGQLDPVSAGHLKQGWDQDGQSCQGRADAARGRELLAHGHRQGHQDGLSLGEQPDSLQDK